METGQQKVKNVCKNNIYIALILVTILFGSWQSNFEPKLNHEQYKIINDAFTTETFLFDKTTTVKSWINLINKEWLKDELWFCFGENQDKIIEELTDLDLKYNLNLHIQNQIKPLIIEKKYLKAGDINIISKDKGERIPKISAPFVYEDKALIYYQSPIEEYIIYLKKKTSGDWERICIFHIFFILTD